MTITSTTVELPSAYLYHPHSSEEARQIAQNGLLLLTRVGSDVHGTSVSGTDDTDLMGFCVEPKEFVLGLSQVPAGMPFAKTEEERQELLERRGRRMHAFEQYERHTAWDRQGVRERSGAGDIDVLVYSIRKWTRLAVDGNPTVLLPLFAPTDAVLVTDWRANWVRENAWRFATKNSIQKFLGYLISQKMAMTGEKSKRTNRPELVSLHGYDTKFAGHALRLGFQGIQFATERTITLPIPEPQLSMIREVRAGEVPLEAVLHQIDTLASGLRTLAARAPLPDRVDEGPINEWLIQTYETFWRNA